MCLRLGVAGNAGFDSDHAGFTKAGGQRLQNVVPGIDRPAIDRSDSDIGRNTGSFQRRALRGCADHGHHGGCTCDRQHPVHEESEQEVGEGTAQRDGNPPRGVELTKASVVRLGNISEVPVTLIQHSDVSAEGQH